MVNSAMKTLYCFSPEVSKWTQAHSAARFAILRALLVWGRGSVQLLKDEKGAYRIYVDPNNLDGCYDAVETLLKHLNYYKTTAQVKSGQELLILEAMKMQTSINSPVDGTIKSINVSAGDTVRESQVLVEFQ